MAESLIDLETLLRSKPEKLSSQELNFVNTWKDKTLQQLTAGAVAGGAFTWSATGRLNRLLRISLAGGVAVISSSWRCRRSVNSCVEEILCMDGTRMQKELANIMLKRYPNHQLIRKHIPKRFYCENVIDDSTTDIPKSRWRFRNTFFENPPHPQQADNNVSYDHDAKIGSERRPVPMSSGFVAMENPFDCIFGLPSSVEEIRNPAPPTSSRKQIRKHNRKSRHRHHSHHEDDME